MKRLAARSSILFFALAFLFVGPVTASPLTSVAEVKFEKEKFDSRLTYDTELPPFASSEWAESSIEVVLTTAGGLVLVKLTGATAAGVKTIALGAKAYSILKTVDSVITGANELLDRIKKDKDEVAKYAKMSYDTLYSLCHDKGGGMMSVKDVTDVAEEIEKDYIFGVPAKNAVCVAN